jgi:hypothetical protein
VREGRHIPIHLKKCVFSNHVVMYVCGCTRFSISKPRNHTLALYTMLPTPFRPWESISMDFLGDFPRTKDKVRELFLKLIGK